MNQKNQEILTRVHPDENNFILQIHLKNQFQIFPSIPAKLRSIWNLIIYFKLFFLFNHELLNILIIHLNSKSKKILFITLFAYFN